MKPCFFFKRGTAFRNRRTGRRSTRLLCGTPTCLQHQRRVATRGSAFHIRLLVLGGRSRRLQTCDGVHHVAWDERSTVRRATTSVVTSFRRFDASNVVPKTKPCSICGGDGRAERRWHESREWKHDTTSAERKARCERLEGKGACRKGGGTYEATRWSLTRGCERQDEGVVRGTIARKKSRNHACKATSIGTDGQGHDRGRIAAGGLSGSVARTRLGRGHRQHEPARLLGSHDCRRDELVRR